MKRCLCLALVPLAAAVAPLRAQAQRTEHYRVVATHTLGGDGGWDYVILEPGGKRLFIGRQDRVMVVDPENGKVLGEVPGIHGAHGIAIAERAGHGFATSGRDSSIVMFDLKTLQPLGRTHADEDADAIIYDPSSNRVFSFNGDGNSSTVVDVATGKAITNIPLGGKPEYGVADGKGRVFANIVDKGEIVEIDPRAMTVVRRWSLAPCRNPTGLSIDARHEILFSGCRSGVMAISDAKSGKLLTTLPIGAGVDATRFDPGTGDAFASNGDGTITVIHEDAPDRFHVVENVRTARGARTMELDPRTHRLYTVTADFGPVPQGAPAGPRRRPPLVPGSFRLLVLER